MLAAVGSFSAPDGSNCDPGHQLGRVSSYEHAEELGAQGIPFAFPTGYGGRGLKGRFERFPVRDKSIDPDRLKLTLNLATGQGKNRLV